VEVALGLVLTWGKGSAVSLGWYVEPAMPSIACGEDRTLLTLTVASLLMTPVPEHGASSKTRSKPPMTLGNSRPS
jgi:hypothetical protein